jgi:hypothetical protein
MESDWEIEIGGAAPVIDALWSGFEDLRASAERANALSEVQQLPGLAEVLVRLNGVTSPVWTSKCDVWPLEEWDADELDAPMESALEGVACYIDLLASQEEYWGDLARAEAWCKGVCSVIREAPLRSCRLDLVIRRALISQDGRNGLGVTAYLSACGPDRGAANEALQAALDAFASLVASMPSAAERAS